jgi:hypothetical protein
MTDTEPEKPEPEPEAEPDPKPVEPRKVNYENPEPGQPIRPSPMRRRATW